MSRLRSIPFSLAAVAASFLSCGQVSRGAETPAQLDPGPAPATALEVSGPFAHGNLEVFLIHGEDRLGAGREILTLEEALAQGVARVHETGDVNNLAIENLSQDADVFVQAGDIVKGGKQDRTIGISLVVEPGSGHVPLAAFCVEQGRWRARAAGPAAAPEAVEEFEMADAAVSSKELKWAVNAGASQNEVWANVRRFQSKIASNVGQNAAFSTVSPSSLQLTLETGELRERITAYVDALAAAADGRDDVVGFAFAINGQVNSAEVYGSSALFRKMWRKGLGACAAEAVAELDPAAEPANADPEAVRALLAVPDGSARERRELTPRVERVSCEYGGHHMFETRDRDRGGRWLHRTYLAR